MERRHSCKPDRHNSQVLYLGRGVPVTITYIHDAVLGLWGSPTSRPCNRSLPGQSKVPAECYAKVHSWVQHQRIPLHQAYVVLVPVVLRPPLSGTDNNNVAVDHVALVAVFPGLGIAEYYDPQSKVRNDCSSTILPYAERVAALVDFVRQANHGTEEGSDCHWPEWRFRESPIAKVGEQQHDATLDCAVFTLHAMAIYAGMRMTHQSVRQLMDQYDMPMHRFRLLTQLLTMTPTPHRMAYNSYLSDPEHKRLVAAAKQAYTPLCTEYGGDGMVDGVNTPVSVESSFREGDDTENASASSVLLCSSQQTSQPPVNASQMGVDARLAATAEVLQMRAQRVFDMDAHPGLAIGLDNEPTTTQGHEDFLGVGMGIRSIHATPTGSRSPAASSLPVRKLQTELTNFFSATHTKLLNDEEGSMWWSLQRGATGTLLQQGGSPGPELGSLPAGQVFIHVQGVPPTIVEVHVASDVSLLDHELLSTMLQLIDVTHNGSTRVVCQGLANSATADTSGLAGRQLVSAESVPVTSLLQLRQIMTALPHESQQVSLSFDDMESSQALAEHAADDMDTNSIGDAQSPDRTPAKKPRLGGRGVTVTPTAEPDNNNVVAPSVNTEHLKRSTQAAGTPTPGVDGMAIDEGSLISDQPSPSVGTTPKTTISAEQVKVLEDQDSILKTTEQNTGPQQQSAPTPTKSIGSMLSAVEGLTVTGEHEEEKSEEKPASATEVTNNICHKLMGTMQALAVANQWQDLVHSLNGADITTRANITTEELKICLHLAQRSAAIGKQEALRQVVRTGGQLGINETEANGERRGHMRIMAILFDAVRELSNIPLLPGEGPLLGQYKAITAAGTADENLGHGDSFPDSGSSDTTLTPILGLNTSDHDRTELEQAPVAQEQQQVPKRNMTTLVEAITSGPQPHGTYYELRPYVPALRSQDVQDALVFVSTSQPVLPVNSAHLQAVVTSEWGQDSPRAGFDYALCDERGELLPFSSDGVSQTPTQQFPQFETSRVVYVGQVWCTDLSKIRIFKDTDGLLAKETAPEWYWNQATYLLMPNAPWYTIDRSDWCKTSMVELIVKACSYLAISGKTKNPVTLAQKFHFLEWKHGKKVVADHTSSSPDVFLAPNPAYRPHVQVRGSTPEAYEMDSPGWWGGRGWTEIDHRNASEKGANKGKGKGNKKGGKSKGGKGMQTLRNTTQSNSGKGKGKGKGGKSSSTKGKEHGTKGARADKPAKNNRKTVKWASEEEHSAMHLEQHPLTPLVQPLPQGVNYRHPTANERHNQQQVPLDRQEEQQAQRGLPVGQQIDSDNVKLRRTVQFCQNQRELMVSGDQQTSRQQCRIQTPNEFYQPGTPNLPYTQSSPPPQVYYQPRLGGFDHRTPGPYAPGVTSPLGRSVDGQGWPQEVMTGTHLTNTAYLGHPADMHRRLRLQHLELEEKREREQFAAQQLQQQHEFRSRALLRRQQRYVEGQGHQLRVPIPSYGQPLPMGPLTNPGLPLSLQPQQERQESHLGPTSTPVHNGKTSAGERPTGGSPDMGGLQKRPKSGASPYTTHDQSYSSAMATAQQSEQRVPCSPNLQQHQHQHLLQRQQLQQQQQSYPTHHQATQQEHIHQLTQPRQGRQQQRSQAQQQQQGWQQQHPQDSHMEHQQQHYVSAPEYAVRSGMSELHSAGTALVASQMGTQHAPQYSTYQVGIAENEAYTATSESASTGQSHTIHGMQRSPTGGYSQGPQAHPAHLADFRNGARE
jgi:hypothetical protein